MIINNLILLMLFVTLSQCHDYQRPHHNHHSGLRSRAGHSIKSYGGYFPDTAGYNEAANNFAHSQNYHHPQASPYQPYGWSLNQPRRTYGGVNVLSHQPNDNSQYPPNHVGWANSNMNSYAGANNFPFFPQFPQPNFYNFPQFPFPTFPNIFPYAGGYPQNSQNYPGSGNGYPQQRPDVGGSVNNQGVPSAGGQLPYPSSNANPGFPTGPSAPPTYPQNNFNQGVPIGTSGQPIHPQNNVNKEVPTGHSGQPNYPQNNFNQGVPIGSSGQPIHPQNNVNKEIPTDNRYPGGAPNQGQLPYPNTNQGFPTKGGSAQIGAPLYYPIQRIPTDQPQLPYPQNNVNQGLPTGNVNRNTGGPSNVIPSNQHTGQTDLQRPINSNNPNPNRVDPAGIDIRYTGNGSDSRPSGSNSIPNKNKDFASNAFFGINDNRHWTEDDELKWQATTKAPYFENKVPGLECTLPAASVLGAENAFKTATLLPLNIPPGKPILSCNATDLLQSQIRLEGKIYDCDHSEVTISCPSHGGTVDECEGQTLKCDVNNYNAASVWCTNGTIISNSDIICESASIMPSKSTLNCHFKRPAQPGIRQNIPSTTERVPNVSILPVVPLPSGTNNIGPTVNRNEDDVNPEYFDFEDESAEIKELKPQLKKAMKNVFPHDLLTMPSTKYLPQQASIQPIDSNLKNHINGVFNADLLASSQNANEVKGDHEKTVPILTLNPSDVFPTKPNEQPDLSSGNWREQQNSNRNYNANRNSNIKDGIKTENRFGGENRPQHNLQERLIFTN